MSAEHHAGSEGRYGEFLLGSVLGSMREGVSVADEQGVIVYTNAAEDRMFGYEPGELLGRHVSLQNSYPPEENLRIVAEVIAELRRGGAWSGEWSNVRKDGTRFTTSARITALEHEGRTYWVCVQDDVTERKRAEARREFLAEATHLLTASLADDATLARVARHCVPFLADYASVDLLTEAGEIRRVETAHHDPEMEACVRELWRRYPYRADERVGVPEVLRTGEALLLPEFPLAQVEAFARDAEHLALLRALGPRSYIAVPLSARGHVYGALSLVFSDSGRRYGPDDLYVARELGQRVAGAVDNARLFHHAESVAARLRAQVDETDLARREAQEANETKSQFLATMSHELRTPLNAVGGYVDLLLMEIHGPVTEAQAEALRRVKRSASHLLGLINDILNFARIEAGHVTFDPRPVPLAPLLADLQPLVAPQLEAKGLRYLADGAPADAVARVDPEKLRQILLNLLSNAIKFTEPNGQIRVGAAVDGDRVRLEVTDTGVGIPIDKLESIFAPFVQVRRGLTAPGEGTGLGLAISRDLARAMGGDLHVGSVEGRGSTFVLTLPRDTGEGDEDGQGEGKGDG